MSKQLTRRRILVGTGALAATAGTGIALTTKESAATANVSGTFAIPDGTAVLADQTLEQVLLKVNAQWEFSANAPISATELELHVGATPDGLDLIARTEKTDLSKKTLTGEETLQGGLTNAGVYSIEDFRPTNGELSRTVIAELRFYVLRDGDVVAEAKYTDTFEVTVRKEELVVDMNVDATGEVSFTSS